jgi:hypothetical protein
VVLVQVRERVLDALALLLQERAKTIGVDAHEPLSFLERSGADAEVRRRSINAGPTPVSSTILSRALRPETIATESRATASAAARSHRRVVETVMPKV